MNIIAKFVTKQILQMLKNLKHTVFVKIPGKWQCIFDRKCCLILYVSIFQKNTAV